MARNRVSSIHPTLANSIPNLSALVLTSNNVAELADLDPLSGFRRLTHLVLLENPVTRKEVSGLELILLFVCIGLEEGAWAWLDIPLLRSRIGLDRLPAYERDAAAGLG